jgi:ribosomal protection tetracycline resistance protein
VDAGKTTTVERMLYACGATRQLGSVDDGTAATDSMDIERARGISVRSASAVISLPGLRLNLIDTPGHMDFMAEVQRALLAVDCGLLIVSAAEGVQSQTELFFRTMEQAGLPVILFVNNIDRVGVDTRKVFAELTKKLSPHIVALNAVKAQGARDCAVEDAAFDDDGVLALCSLDATLEDGFARGTLSQKQLEDSLFRLCARGCAYPLVYGSAACDVGIDKLLGIIPRLPRICANADGPLSGKIYKIEHDKAMGKAAHIRLFSGQIQNRDTLTLLDGCNPRAEPRTEKVTQIRQFSTGTKLADCGRFSGGDIAVLYGLASAKVGDIVGEICAARHAPPLQTTPLFHVRVTDGNPNPTPLLTAVRELAEEDPLLSCEWEPDERELTVSIMGEVQIEVLRHLLAARYGIRAEFSPPSVIYKETVREGGTGYERYTMPKPCWAVIELGFEPLPAGSGYVYESTVQKSQIPQRYQNHIETALPEAMKQGLYGWEVTDVKITLIGGGWHHIHTHPLDFFLATPLAFMNGMVNCGSQLLEPFLRLNIAVPEEASGKLISEIINMRGEICGSITAGGRTEIEACAPLSEAMDFSVRVNSLASGKAQYASRFDGYRPCPLELGKTARRRGVDPLDRAKWILYKRGAL